VVVKPIEAIIRSPAWDNATKAKLRAHLAKRMTDDQRIRYCDRKAYFLAEAGKLHQAIELLEWALATYKADGEFAAYARGQLADLREQVTAQPSIQHPAIKR
jgi:hypothetical protein